MAPETGRFLQGLLRHKVQLAPPVVTPADEEAMLQRQVEIRLREQNIQMGFGGVLDSLEAFLEQQGTVLYNNFVNNNGDTANDFEVTVRKPNVVERLRGKQIKVRAEGKRREGTEMSQTLVTDDFALEYAVTPTKESVQSQVEKFTWMHWEGPQADSPTAPSTVFVKFEAASTYQPRKLSYGFMKSTNHVWKKEARAELVQKTLSTNPVYRFLYEHIFSDKAKDEIYPEDFQVEIIMRGGDEMPEVRVTTPSRRNYMPAWADYLCSEGEKTYFERDPRAGEAYHQVSTDHLIELSKMIADLIPTE